MDYKKLAEDLLSYCHLNCSACEYAGDTLECTIKQLASTAITDLLARAEEAEERCKKLESRCKRLDEARENANEAAAKWEGMYRGKKEELEMSENEVSVMSAAGMEMLNAFAEYVRNGSKNPAAYCYFGAAGCGGDGDGCKGVGNCNFLPKAGMKARKQV